LTEVANYVELRPGKPVELVADQLAIVPRRIRDPVTGFTKTVNALVLHVTRLDGVPADTQFSTVSEKLKAQLLELHRLGQLLHRRIRITKWGSGFTSEFQVEVLGPA